MAVNGLPACKMKDIARVVVLFLLLSCCLSQDIQDGMKITSSVTFPAQWPVQLKKGIEISASNILVDFGANELIGENFTGCAISLKGQNNVTLRNLVASGFYYAVYIKNAKNITLYGLNLSGNWLGMHLSLFFWNSLIFIDPNAYNPTPPWLDINVKPTAFGDRTNLGGGLWLEECDGLIVKGSTFSNQENGIDAWEVTNSVFHNIDASHNVGWGLHFYRSSNNVIQYSKADYCNRGPGKTGCSVTFALMKR